MEKRYIISNQKKIYYYLNKKNIKNINIRIKSNGDVFLSCPLKMKTEDAEKFLIQKANWVLKQQEQLKKYYSQKEQLQFENSGKIYFLGRIYNLKIITSKINLVEIIDENINIYIKEKYIENKKYIRKYFENWLKEKSYEIYNGLVVEYQDKMSKYVKSFPQIEVKKLKTRWGSCMPFKNKVTFNLSLIKAPIECVEYVVVHELAHFKYQNHSKNFYNLVEIYIPDWKDRRNLLNKEYSILV